MNESKYVGQILVVLNGVVQTEACVCNEMEQWYIIKQVQWWNTDMDMQAK